MNVNSVESVLVVQQTTVNWPITEERTKNPKVMAVRDFLVSSTIWVVFMEGGSS